MPKVMQKVGETPRKPVPLYYHSQGGVENEWPGSQGQEACVWGPSCGGRGSRGSPWWRQREKAVAVVGAFSVEDRDICEH